MIGKMSIVKGIVFRDFAPALVLVATSLIWYVSIYTLFGDLIGKLALPDFTKTLLFGAFFAAFAISAFFGGWLFPRARKLGLVFWMIFGSIMSLSLVTIPINNLIVNFILSVLLGVSVGVGLPSALAFFADSTPIWKRGILGGITWSTVGFGALAIGGSISFVETTLGLVILSIWRVIGLVFFLALTRAKQEPLIKKPSEKYKRILSRRDLILYLAPWIMFSLVNFAEVPISQNLLGEFATMSGLITLALSGIFAIVGGMFADRIGRKRVVITGFVFLGIEYAILSFFYENPVSWYIYTCFDGAAWGMFAAVFFMTLWGDLSESFQREKYYVLGGLPYLLAGFLPVLIEPYKASIEASTAFTIASFFLFVAVLPLFYAPETLPEKTMKDRDLSSYIERAKKIVEKENAKKQKQVPNKTDSKNEDASEELQESPEDKKARELAEKYY